MLQPLFGKSLDFPPESGDETAVLDLMGELILLISIVGDENVRWAFCRAHGKSFHSFCFEFYQRLERIGKEKCVKNHIKMSYDLFLRLHINENPRAEQEKFVPDERYVPTVRYLLVGD